MVEEGSRTQEQMMAEQAARQAQGQLDMAEQNLNRPQVRSRFEQMGSPAMAQGVRRYMLGDARMESGFFTGVPHGLVGNGLFLAGLALAAGEQIGAGFFPAPIFSQGF